MTLLQWVRRPRLLLGVFLVLLIVVLGVSGGCGAYRRPGGLTAAERQLLASPPLPYRVSIVPWDAERAARTSQDPERYAESLALLVNGSHAFRVSRLETAAAADSDLVATASGAYCNAAIVPIFSIISLGIIPTVFDDRYCVGLVLHRGRGPSSADSVTVDFEHRGRVVMGWAALAIGALPGWSWGSPDRDARYRERFRLEVIRHQAEIRRLVAQ
jgi:hypothetical protein